MKTFLTIILVVAGLAILGLVIEHVVNPVLGVFAFLLKWGMLIGIPLFILISVIDNFKKKKK